MELIDSRKQLVTKRACGRNFKLHFSGGKCICFSVIFRSFFIFDMMPQKTKVTTSSMGSNNLQVNALKS